MTRGVVVDAGPLIAVDRGNQAARELLTLFETRGSEILVPTPVLAQVWRPHPGRRLRELLAAAVILPLDARLARAAGELLGRSQTSDVVDAVVAMTAALRGFPVLTSDPGDFHRLADELRGLRVVAI